VSSRLGADAQKEGDGHALANATGRCTCNCRLVQVVESSRAAVADCIAAVDVVCVAKRCRCRVEVRSQSSWSPKVVYGPKQKQGRSYRSLARTIPVLELEMTILSLSASRSASSTKHLWNMILQHHLQFCGASQQNSSVCLLVVSTTEDIVWAVANAEITIISHISPISALSREIDIGDRVLHTVHVIRYLWPSTSFNIVLRHFHLVLTLAHVWLALFTPICALSCLAMASRPVQSPTFSSGSWNRA